MTMRRIYLLLCVAGTILPYWQFAPWLAAHGPNLPLLLRELFANRVSGFFALDVVASALVVFVFAYSERRTLRFWWLPILALLCIGVSLGLSLLLYLRETDANRTMSRRATA